MDGHSNLEERLTAQALAGPLRERLPARVAKALEADAAAVARFLGRD